MGNHGVKGHLKTPSRYVLLHLSGQTLTSNAIVGSTHIIILLSDVGSTHKHMHMHEKPRAIVVVLIFYSLLKCCCCSWLRSRSRTPLLWCECIKWCISSDSSRLKSRASWAALNSLLLLLRVLTYLVFLSSLHTNKCVSIYLHTLSWNWGPAWHHYLPHALAGLACSLILTI